MPDWPVDKEKGGVVHGLGGGGGVKREKQRQREQFKELSDPSMQGS